MKTRKPHGRTHTQSGDEMGRIKIGTSIYRQTNLAFFAAGFVTFVTLYNMQPLLPEFAREFGVSPALSSLPLSVATATLSLAMLFAGTLSETWGRKQVMIASLFLTSFLTFLTAFGHEFVVLLTLRLLQGLALAGLPAVAMAYLSEEMDVSALSSAMGLYISGNAVGGMAGRLYTAAITDLWGWRYALGSTGVFCLILSFFFAKGLPPSHLRQRPFEFRYLFSSLARHLKDPLLLCLYGISFMVMGSFVTLFNYITFRLLAPPYGLTQSHVSLIFLSYLLGSLSASFAGRLVNRFGRCAIIRLSLLIMAIGISLTLMTALAGIIAGVAVFTIGFFGVHSVASSWVGRRALTAKAQASALYLFFYYLGSSISGTAGGVFWLHGGWSGVVGLIILLVLAAMILVVLLSRMPEAGCQHTSISS